MARAAAGGAMCCGGGLTKLLGAVTGVTAAALLAVTAALDRSPPMLSQRAHPHAPTSWGGGLGSLGAVTAGAGAGAGVGVTVVVGAGQAGAAPNGLLALA